MYETKLKKIQGQGGWKYYNVHDVTVNPKMSFIPTSPECHFPLENLPYGVFSTESNVCQQQFDVC